MEKVVAVLSVLAFCQVFVTFAVMVNVERIADALERAHPKRKAPSS